MVQEVSHWMSANRFKLNSDKIEGNYCGQVRSGGFVTGVVVSVVGRINEVN